MAGGNQQATVQSQFGNRWAYRIPARGPAESPAFVPLASSRLFAFTPSSSLVSNFMNHLNAKKGLIAMTIQQGSASRATNGSRGTSRKASANPTGYLMYYLEAKKNLTATVATSEFGPTNWNQRLSIFSNRNKNTLSASAYAHLDTQACWQAPRTQSPTREIRKRRNSLKTITRGSAQSPTFPLLFLRPTRLNSWPRAIPASGPRALPGEGKDPHHEERAAARAGFMVFSSGVAEKREGLGT
jgi:hypothetical protein